MRITKDTVFFITGGASGLGEAAAREIHAKGARVAIADMNQERLDLIKNELCHNIIPYELDEAIDNWDEIRNRIERNNGNLDVFLFHYLNSIDECQSLRQQLDKRRGVEKWEKKNYPPAPEKYVFEIYGELISAVGPQKFIEDLLIASNNYTGFINPTNSKIYFYQIYLLKNNGIVHYQILL
jgi:hypothetical protein